MSEEEISLVLNTYMYLDYKEAEDGMSIREIVSELETLPDYKEGGIHHGEYTVLAKAAANPQIGNMVIDNQSHLMGYDTGTAACSFRSSEGESIYIVYRGTGDGEWPDNGVGMTESATPQQEKALAYFEEVVECTDITLEDRVIVTGHSKGGNKAQYVTMTTRYGNLLDVCYNVDGQGFSEKAIDGFSDALGEQEFHDRRQKIMGIYGENDYVNVLGISIVPKENECYIRTPVDKADFAAYHDIKYMFSERRWDEKSGTWQTVFNGNCNDYALKRGALGDYAARLSASMMQLPEGRRDGCAAFMMQMMEATRGSSEGINGEKLSLLDVDDFGWAGIPTIKESLLATPEGCQLLGAAFEKDSFSIEMQGTVQFMLRAELLQQQVTELSGLALLLQKEEKEIDEIADRLSKCLWGNFDFKWKLAAEKQKVAQTGKSLKKLAKQLSEIVLLYEKKDEEAAALF